VTYCIAHSPEKLRWFYKEIAQEYKKWLNRFCKIQLLNKNVKTSERDLVIFLYPDGLQLSSEEMASRLQRLELSGKYFRYIFSLNPFVHYDETWALMSVALPLDLLTVILLEQIYRAQKIIHNEAYHK